MTHYEIDHLFIWATVGAPEAELLTAIGLTEGSANRHPGQGTANRRFFFQNLMLELLWVCDSAEAQSSTTRPTRLWDRWSEEAGSPFGVCLRPGSSDTRPPFPGWEYRPGYLPADLRIHMGDPAPLVEPMWFYLDFGRRPDAARSSAREPLDHSIGLREVTTVKIVSPSSAKPSATARAVVEAGLLTLATGQEHLLELTFDQGMSDRRRDFRPHLPLVLRW